ncbi:hypothetical protein [Frigoriglobus tundricola]|uniref:Glycosyltransferase RgtA/B/C/D-like domain-containing protein n=1 Tax=Frigoriglobus tundricola TaxID=2774151 RepID=A0A6M5YH82_9BACT|nr:hypothetical protein [Frigoriglobus tundricola]QJW93397.1 hypothetical protein FTUN_0903 [Frigoriglobus tundricola]
MTQTYTPPAPATSATFRSLRRLLLLFWAAFTLVATSFVVFLGTNAPYADEWEFVPALVGEEPAGPWLWQQHNEHRFPLPRAVFLVLFRLTHDFRAGMLLQVAMLSGLALFLMRFAERLRGRPHWTDLFFPVSLLHIGNWENFVMGYQICFALFAVLATGLIVVALRTTRENAFPSGATAGTLLFLLALTGGAGLVVVPPVSAWLVFVALSVWRGGASGRAALLLVLAVLPLAYLGAYFSGYQRPPHHPEPSTDPRAVARVAGEVLAVSFGIGVSGVWAAVCAGVLALGGITVAALVSHWKVRTERLSIAGLLAVAAGVTGVAVAIGVGRGGWGAGMGLWARYSLLTWPLLAAAYLVWVPRGRAAAPQTVSRAAKWVPVVLCVVAALAFPANTGTGMLNGAAVKSTYSAMGADARAGMRAEEIVARRFPNSAQAGQEDRAVRAIPLLRAARIGIFAEK